MHIRSLVAASILITAFAATISFAAAPAASAGAKTPHPKAKLAASGPVAMPSADEVAKVAAYYFDGKSEGPMLVRAVACLKVDESADSPTKNECVQPVSGAVAKDTEVVGWTQWAVPVGGKFEDASIQFLFNGEVHATQDLTLEEGLRVRTWGATRMSKPGTWTIRVQRGGKELASTNVEVK